MNFERNRKYVARNTIVNKTVAKKNKAKGKKQETGNKEHRRIGFIVAMFF